MKIMRVLKVLLSGLAPACVNDDSLYSNVFSIVCRMNELLRAAITPGMIKL